MCPVAIRESVLKHFGDIESSEIISVTELTDKYNRCAQQSQMVRPHIDNIVSKAELLLMFSKANTDKAAGPDGVPDDVFHIAPRELTDIYHPLMTKIGLRGLEL